MITITRRTARNLRTVFRKAFGGSKSTNPTVTFESNEQGLFAWAKFQGLVLINQIAETQSHETVHVPLNALAECEAASDQPVEIESTSTNGSTANATLRWQDGDVPQVAEFETNTANTDQPAWPEQTRLASADLLQALSDAAEITDQSSSRYALDCIQLMGASGRIAATDGKQMLVTSGFDFPWEEDLLVPANGVFKHRALMTSDDIFTGRTDDHVVIMAGPWTVFLPIDADRKFPDAMSHIPNRNEAQSSVTITETDAEFVSKSIKRLPSTDDHYQPVTLDVNGRVVIRAEADCRQPTELVLTNSTMTGTPTRINTNRRYIERAAKLGLRNLNLYGPDRPAHGCDDSRDYVWIPLTQDGIVDPTDDCIRIESPVADASSNRIQALPPRPEQPSTPGKRQPNTMKRPPQTHSTSTTTTTTTNAEAAGVDAMIESAEAVRTSLREAATTVSRLIAELKRHRKQSKTIRTALSSLRELDTIGA